MENFTLQQAQELLNSKLIFTQDDYAVCAHFLPEEAEEHLFYHSWDNTWLNLNIYSEADKEERDFQIERGL